MAKADKGYKAPKIKPSHKGLLHKDLGVPAGQKIGKARLEQAKQSSDPAIRKRANFALNFNDNGSHGTVTAINQHNNGKHVRIDVAHGRRKKPKDGSAASMAGYDDRPTSSIVVPKSQAGQFKIGQRVGVGAVPLQGPDTDEMDDNTSTPAPAARTSAKSTKKSAKKGKAKRSASKAPSPIANAMGANC